MLAATLQREPLGRHPPVCLRAHAAIPLPQVAVQVASVVLPVPVECELHQIARAHHRAHPEGVSVSHWVDRMRAPIPRVIFPGSLAAASRQAYAGHGAYQYSCRFDYQLARPSETAPYRGFTPA